ncbi:MAG: polyprenyl diphosphate synthase [Pseudomonadales bacterium]
MGNKAAVNDVPSGAGKLETVPRHVAIIMDGNNRWAKLRHLPGAAGHKAGLESVKAVMRACAELGVETLTLFAFSSENWRRPETEVSALMSLFLTALRREVKKMHKSNIRLKVIGNRSRFSDNIQQGIEQAEQLTANNNGCTVVIAADYGGQWDIVQAAQSLAEEVRMGDIGVADITEQSLQAKICLGDMAMPDLCIRTGGERRISNFLLWQMAYTELYFTDLYWPDFGREQFLDALTDFQRRDRRFGHTSNDTDSKDSEDLGA